MNCLSLVRDHTQYHFSETQYGNRIAFRLLCKDIIIVIILFLLPLAAAACKEQPTPYRPPTIAAQVTRPMLTPSMPTAPSQVAETQLPLTTATCADNLTYLEDLSLPEGTVVQSGASLDKRWLVKNSGTCNWDERYRLKLVSGAELNASIDQALYPARSGAKVTIRIVFTAPYTPGTYQNAWQAFDPRGQPFGDLILLRVVVNSDQP